MPVEVGLALTATAQQPIQPRRILCQFANLDLDRFDPEALRLRRPSRLDMDSSVR
jgi:hypothetical protein